MSGNPVPPGAFPEEVRDDVPINASEGEYVLSADIVRYIGLDKIQKMEKQAKEGIAEMEAGGRVGGEPSMPEMPPIPQEGAMFNTGGLVTAEDREFTDTSASFSNIHFGDPMAFSPRDFISGRGQQTTGQQRVQKFIGPDGRILYIPINSAGQLLFAPPEGFARSGEPPKTEQEAVKEVEEQTEVQDRSPMWSDGLTTSQIREEQANRTFRTYDQLNPSPQGTGQLPGFLGDALSGLTNRISAAFDRLTSGEAIGAIAQLGLTLAGQPMLGKVAAVAFDKFNEKRQQEGLPKMSVEEIAKEVSVVSPLSQGEIIEIANNAQITPSNYKVSQEATREGALDLDSYTLLGTMGTEEDPRYMVRGPDGSIMTVKPGDEIDGVLFEGLQSGVGDPIGKRLSDVAILSGQLPTTRSDTTSSTISPTAGLGRSQVGFGGPTPPTPTINASRGLSPTSQGVSFNTSDRETSSDRAFAEQASRSGVGRTGTGSDSVSQAFSSNQGSGNVRDTSSQGLSMGTPTSGPQNPSGSVGFSMGSPVSSGGNFSNFDSNNPRGFSRGGLVNSPYKNYDIAKGYKKGGLVKRNCK